MKSLLISILSLFLLVCTGLSAYEIKLKRVFGNFVTVNVDKPVTIKRVREALARKVGMMPAEIEILKNNSFITDSYPDFELDYKLKNIMSFYVRMP
jgi:hypothetical protein